MKCRKVIVGYEFLCRHPCLKTLRTSNARLWPGPAVEDFLKLSLRSDSERPLREKMDGSNRLVKGHGVFAHEGRLSSVCWWRMATIPL